MSRPTSASLVASLCRFVLNVRLFAVLVTVVWVSTRPDPTPALSAALVLAALLTLAALLRWNQIAAVVMRHPSFLAVDFALAMAILLVAGPTSPFFYFTVGTAALAGILYRWVGAAFFSVLLVVGYMGIVGVHAPLVDLPLTFQTLVGLPLLYPITAAAGAAARGLLERLIDTEAALAEQVRCNAVADERARFAREMHDSLAKTLHGMAFSARAIAAWAERAPERAAADAELLARAADAAAAEARDMIGDLRADQLGEPLERVVTQVVERWGQRTSVAAVVAAEGSPETTPEARYELMCILKEALRNVEQHADATQVTVRLSADRDTVALVVADDGVGIGGALDVESLADRGHYGLLGMAERAARVGGSVAWTAGDEGGLRLRAAIPRGGGDPAAPPRAPVGRAAGQTA